MNNNNLLFSNQFGYQKKKSTKLALINFINKCVDALEGGEAAIGCFIDLSKAFDTVNHKILLNKLVKLGIKGTVLNWFTSYLANRTHQTVIDFTRPGGQREQFASKLSYLQVGVPQGSILGPILFLIYINDIADYIPINSLTIFADDTSLFSRHKDLTLLEQENHILINELSQYFSELHLNINSKKSNYIFFSTDSKKRCMFREGVDAPSVCLGEEFLETSETVDYLGVRLDGGLSWNDHVSKLANILSGNVFVLRNIATLNCLHLSRLVYFSLIESHLRYLIVLWGNSSKQNLMKIFVIQKRAIRAMLKLRPRDSCHQHFIDLSILTVPSLFMFESICYVKEHNLIQPHNHDYNTRNRHLNPSIQHRLKLFEIKPEFVGLKLFSKLPQGIRDINDIKKFKTQLKSYLLKGCFYNLPL